MNKTLPEIALDILLRMMENHLFPNNNPELGADGHIDPEKVAGCYNKILSALKTESD